MLKFAVYWCFIECCGFVAGDSWVRDEMEFGQDTLVLISMGQYLRYQLISQNPKKTKIWQRPLPVQLLSRRNSKNSPDTFNQSDKKKPILIIHGTYATESKQVLKFQVRSTHRYESFKFFSHMQLMLDFISNSFIKLIDC